MLAQIDDAGSDQAFARYVTPLVQRRNTGRRLTLWQVMRHCRRYGVTPPDLPELDVMRFLAPEREKRNLLTPFPQLLFWPSSVNFLMRKRPAA